MVKLWRLKYFLQQSLLDKKITELTIPKGVVIGGIVRNKELIFPDENTILLVKDKLIIFSEPSSIKDIEKYSEVNIEFF